MLQILYKYLVLNKKASFPGIGVFYIRRLPASLDFSNKAFVAPSAQISFTEKNVVADNNFYLFLAKEQQIEEKEAIQSFSDFTGNLKESLQAKGRVELGGFGVLSKDETGFLRFHPAKPLPSFFENVATERTIREISESDQLALNAKRKEKQAQADSHQVKTVSYKKDYWWVFAILLAGLAIAAIIYYYAQNGSFR